MKKTLVALAALAAATGAFAQSPNARAIDGSGVTIFGVADATITRLSTDGAAITQMSGDGRNESTRLGFRGVEDMGGGWAAGFWLEAAYDQDRGTGSNTTMNTTNTGDKAFFNFQTNPVAPSVQSLGGRQGLTFNRAAVVSLLSKDIGEIRVGRDYAPSFWNYTVYDPFGTVGVGSALHVIGGSLTPFGAQNSPPGGSYALVRNSNSVGWLSNNMSGFRLQLQMALSEQPTSCATPNSAVNTNFCYGQSGDGKSIGARLNYNNGRNLDASVALQQVNYGNVATQAAPALDVTFGTITTTPSAGTATTTIAASTAAAPFANPTAYVGNLNIFNAGAAYTMGATKLVASWGTINRDANVTTVQQKLMHTGIGVVHSMGAWTLKASYNMANRTDGTTLSTGVARNTAGNTGGFEDGARLQQTAIGAVYDLSKRTAIYGTYSSNTLTTGAITGAALRANMGFAGPAIAANTSSTTTGLDIGVRHRF